MDKNSIIGFVLIGALLVGFTFYQNRQFKKQAELANTTPDTAVTAVDSLMEVTADTVLIQGKKEVHAIYKDELLELAHNACERFVTIENDELELVLSTRGGQPYSARLKNFYNYDSTDLYLFRPGEADFDVKLYTNEYVNTADFNFEIASATGSEVVMRLPFANGGYIERSYVIDSVTCMVQNQLAFVGMETLIPRNVSMVDMDFNITIPRMEKGYKNEAQYSKVDYYFDGDKKPGDIGRSRSGSKRIDSKLSWFAFQQQFFSTIVRSKSQFSSGDIAVTCCDKDDPARNLMICSAKMRQELPAVRTGRMSYDYEMYFGPNHYKTLKSYEQGYEKIIPLGGNIVGLFTKFVIIPMFDWLHKYFANFGIIILLMTIIIKTVVLPFTYKSYASSSKMQALKPFVEKINEKYPKQEDAMKKQQATMELYKKAGVSPMGGCLPTLLSLPILWAMFRFFPASIELRQQPFLWAKDLSAYDSIIDFGTNVPLIGDHLSLFALLMAATMWLYSKMTMSGQAASNDPNAQSMKFMSVWMMPIMMFFICNGLSAALSYYYLLSQLISMFQMWIIRKNIDKDAIVERVKAAEGKPVPKSKWQLRLEEAQRMQQQQLKERQKIGKR